ncbi:synaptosomal-associated protein 25 isoform X7 [Bombyx mori]
MDQINADMREAEKNLSGMEKCCGICVLPCNKGASFKEDDGTWKGNDDGKVVNNQPQRVMDERNGIGPQAGYIGRITNDAREDEMEENMGQVNTMIGNLRNMALDMGSELENQNRQIDRINRKVRSNGSSQPYYVTDLYSSNKVNSLNVYVKLVLPDRKFFLLYSHLLLFKFK